MAAPVTDAGEFDSWLNDRLDSLEVDREVYGAYIVGVLQEEESDEERGDALQGILSAFLVNIWSGMSHVATGAVLSASAGSYRVTALLSVAIYGATRQILKCFVSWGPKKPQGSGFALRQPDLINRPFALNVVLLSAGIHHMTHFLDHSCISCFGQFGR